MRTFDLAGKPVGEVQLPGIGTVTGFAGSKKDKETFYVFTSFTAQPTVYRYDLASGRSTLFKSTQEKAETDDYETRQVFYPGKDGTQIPMFIVHKKRARAERFKPCVPLWLRGLQYLAHACLQSGNYVLA